MKKLLNLLIMSMLCTVGQSQVVSDGWYYFKYPASNVFGVPYNLNEKSEVSYTGGDILPLHDSSAYLIQNGPDNATYAENEIKTLVLTSLFNRTRNIDLNVRTVKLKRVLLKGSYWQDFKENNYYMVEGLRADSVFITGSIKDTTASDSKDLETLISTFATPNTIAFKVVSELKDSTKKTGLIQFKRLKKYSFTIAIQQKDVYFAAKFVYFKTNSSDYWKKPYCFTSNGLQTETVENNETILLNCRIDEINKGINYSSKFLYIPARKCGVVQIIQKETSKKAIVLFADTSYISSADNMIHFNDEFPISTDPQLVGHHTAEDYVINVDYKLDYIPSEKSIRIHGYENEGGQETYQNCVYVIKSVIKYWPQR